MTKKHLVKVLFQPDGITSEIEKGETILTAAKQAELILTIPCGGHGKCGKCVVKVKHGNVLAKGTFHSDHFSKEEIAEGYCLACQTTVESDLQVFIPSESRITDQKILSKSFSETKFKINPLLRNIECKITKPEDYSNIADCDRLIIAIRKILKESEIKIPISLISSLPKQLRENNWLVTSTIAYFGKSSSEVQEILPPKEKTILYGLAIDIGTTTLVVALINLESGEIESTRSTFNSQMLYGEEVITRIHYASENEYNLLKLQKLIVNDINTIIKSFPVESEDIRTVVISGNTVMTHLLYGIDPSFVWREPYTPAINRYQPIVANNVGLKISDKSLLYSTPGVSSFVGGDIIAGILISGLHLSEEPSFLIDIGTNGEIVLGCKSWIISCSVPAGPALEGAEVKCGMRAAFGAIERISLNSDTLSPDISVIGNGKPIGICGSGLIDLLSELFEKRLITKDGSFTQINSDRIRVGKSGKEFVLITNENTVTGNDIVLTESDISKILKSKGSFYAGCKILLKSFNLTFKDIKMIYVAGGFGSHINVKNAITLGLLPDISHDKIEYLGNSSLGGARLVLLSRENYDFAFEISKNVTNIELSNNYDFMDEYTLASFIPHTHLEEFPSIRGEAIKNDN